MGIRKVFGCGVECNCCKKVYVGFSLTKDGILEQARWSHWYIDDETDEALCPGCFKEYYNK